MRAAFTAIGPAHLKPRRNLRHNILLFDNKIIFLPAPGEPSAAWGRGPTGRTAGHSACSAPREHYVCACICFECDSTADGGVTRVVYAWYGSVSLVTFLLRKVRLCAHERAAGFSLALGAPTSVVVACL